MAMDFFEHQDLARRKSGRLILYFMLAVMAIILSVYVATMLALNIVMMQEVAEDGASRGLIFFQPVIFVFTVFGTLFLVGAGSAYKILSLRDGGESVALSLGGRLVDPATSDLDERKLLNIVEEMAIASGTSVPPVYVLDDEISINAFAAGYSSNDAVIGVTRGCMHLLNRDELQGVIAHEFSHIMNGDMRINIRLMGCLHGILMLAMIGYVLLRLVFIGGGRGSRSRSSKKGGGGGGAILAIALFAGLMIAIGYIGVFFGRLIKSALSRQREYLADASSVQFTRNPLGIAGALRKIGGLTAGSRIENSHAEEASHMFFGNALQPAFLAEALATHPPLVDRIKRIDHDFDGIFPTIDLTQKKAGTKPPPLPKKPPAYSGDDLFGESAGGRSRNERSALGREIFGENAEDMLLITPAMILAQIGSPSTRHIEYARELRDSIPPALVQAAREAYGARAIVYGLLLDRDSADLRGQQLKQLEIKAEPVVYEDTCKLLPEFERLLPRQRLALIDIAMPALQALSEEQFRAFQGNVQALAEADNEISLFEYAIQGILRRHLEPKFSGRKTERIQYYSIKGVADSCAVLMAALAHQGVSDEDEARRCYEGGMQSLELSPKEIPFVSQDQCSLAAVDEALQKLRGVSPKIKRQLIEASVICISLNGRIAVEEAELLRVVADALGCPMPPVLPEQDLLA